MFDWILDLHALVCKFRRANIIRLYKAERDLEAKVKSVQKRLEADFTLLDDYVKINKQQQVIVLESIGCISFHS